MIIDWLAAALELSGSWKIGDKKKIGFILAALCNITWMIVAMMSTPKLYGLFTLVVISFFLNVRNYLKWRKEEKAKISESGKEK